MSSDRTRTLGCHRRGKVESRGTCPPAPKLRPEPQRRYSGRCSLGERKLVERRVRGESRVQCRRARAALRDRFDRTVNRQAGSLVLLLLDFLFHFCLQLRLEAAYEMPPAYRYAAMQLLHGSIYESSLIYRPLINSWLQKPWPAVKLLAFVP